MAQTHAQHVATLQTMSPVVLYGMADASGSTSAANSASGSSVGALPMPNATFGVPGPFGSGSTAADITEQVGQSVALPAVALYPSALSAWLRHTALNARARIFVVSSGSSNTHMQISQGIEPYGVYGTRQANATGRSIAVNTWYHVAVTGEPGQVPRIYFNGQRYDGADAVLTTTGLRAWLTLGVITAQSPGGTWGAESVRSTQIGPLAVLARVLSDADVALLYSGDGGGPPPPPTELQITTTALPNAVRGQPYSVQLQAVGGTPPYEWDITSGQLPAGLSLDSATGVISGTPT